MVDDAWVETYNIKLPDAHLFGRRVALDENHLWISGMRELYLWKRIPR
ncbi:MAG: hypothetical protein WBB42_13100 [Polyangiales bacterium]